jgi:hypothetical protein
MTTPFIHPVTRATVKLGRTIARRNGKSRARALLAKTFLDTLPVPPATVDYTFGITAWGLMLNDNLGDCTIACPGHLIQSWTASAGKEVTVPDSVILAAYEAWDGYVNGNAATDNGGDILTVLQDWQAQGLGGFEITASAEINLTQLRISQAIYAFGGANCGVALPLTAQSQVGGTWDVIGDGKTGPSAPGSWGLHCTAVVAYNAIGPVCVTWGQLQQMTWSFFMNYYDEAHAVISPNFEGPIATADLANDLQEVGM